MEFSQSNLAFYFKEKLTSSIKKLQRFIETLSDCDLCGGNCQSQTLICDFCLADLPFFDLTPLQGNLLLWPAISALLPQRKFDQLIAVSAYQWPVDLWVRQLKYQGRFELATLLSALLFQQWRKALLLNSENDEYFKPPSILISVPIHLKKWQQRGFNQAHLLASKFSHEAGITYLPNALIRVSDNKSQAGQTGVRRRKNLRNIFKLSPELLSLSSQKTAFAEHVLLLDDVVTTGSTCDEICRVLKRHGVKKITVLTLCLSLPKTKVETTMLS